MKPWRGLIVATAVMLSLVVSSQWSPSASAGSSIVEDTDVDFSDGAFVDTKVAGTGASADIRLGNTTGWGLIIPPVPMPPPRRYHSMVYVDSLGQPMTLFGQCSGEPCYLDDLWAFDTVMQTWTQRSSFGAGRAGVAAAYELTRDRIVIFGGFDTYAGWDYYQDTCVHDVLGNVWACLMTSPPPAPRAFAQMVYYPGFDVIFLFGGEDNTTVYDDTWIFDGVNWFPMGPPTTPPARSGHSIVFNWMDDSLLMFGGNQTRIGGGALNDTWRYNFTSSNWESVPTSTAPPARSGHAMSADPVTGFIYLFGGRDVNGDLFDDTWVFDPTNDTWHNVTGLTPPPARHGHTMTSTATGETYLYAGSYPVSPTSTELWLLRPGTNQGSYVSASLDSGGQTWAQWRTVSWSPASQPPGTSLAFQFAASVDNVLWSFIGPDGTAGSEYTGPGAVTLNVSHFEGKRYFRYRVIFRTNAFFAIPSLDTITIGLDRAPFPPVPTYPSPGAILSQEPTLSWNFSDPDGDPQEAFTVEIDDDPGFGSVDFTSLDVLLPTMSWDPGLLPDGVWNWRVRVRADSQWTAFVDGGNFTLDSGLPDSDVLSPIDGGFFRTLAAISGNASDGLSGVAIVDVAIVQESTNYWNGSGWIPTETWLPASGAEDWTFDASSVNWIQGQYVLRSRATDAAGNVEVAVPSVTITIDTTPPTSNITAPPDGSVLRMLPLISGNASDGLSGVAGVEVAVVQGAADYWNGSAWVAVETWLAASGTEDWTYDLSSVDWQEGQYVLRARATDTAGNPQVTITAVGITIDTTPPVVSVTSPASGEAVPPGRPYTIQWSATDANLGAGSISVHYSLDGGSTWAVIEEGLDPTDSYVWDTPQVSTDGVLVRVEATDMAGNVGEDTSDPFTLGVAAPPSVLQEYWWLLVVILLAVLMAVVFLLRRKRTVEEPSGAPPPVIETAETATVCGICLGGIKAGLTVARCGECGKTFHDSCAERVDRCPSCETEIDMNEVRVIEDESEEGEFPPPPP